MINSKDILAEDIETSVDEMLTNILNAYNLQTLRRAPKLMKATFKKAVMALEAHIEDLENECDHEDGNFNLDDNGSMVCADCNQKV